MAHRPVAHGLSRHQMRVSRLLGRFGSFALAAVSTFAVVVNTFVESFSSARLGPVILLLFLLHLVRHAAFIFPREFALYVWLFCYVAIELLWSVDIKLAMNTLAPAAAFVLILMQFGALATYHDLRAVLFGALGGFLAGAALYTSISGFPFEYPVDFSYNAIAGMYLMGLLVVLLLSLYSRWKGLLLVVGAVLLLLIVATTSIKTNLGILLGAGAAGLMYLGHFTQGTPPKCDFSGCPYRRDGVSGVLQRCAGGETPERSRSSRLGDRSSAVPG